MREKIMKIFDHKKSKVGVTAAFFAILLILPVIISLVCSKGQQSYFLNIFIMCCYWAALTTSWNLVAGYLGIFSMAHQVFFGIGAYATAMCGLYFGTSPWLGFLIGGVCAALISIVIAVPCLRLKKAPYIIIATMALAEIFRLVFTNLKTWTRGSSGFWQIHVYENAFGIDFSGMNKIPYYYLILIIFAVIVGVSAYLTKSSTGLAMEAIRESQDAAEAIGVNIAATKIKVFVISAFMAGVVGAFYAHYMKILTPDGMFGQNLMTEFIAMSLFGGTGIISGPIFGAFFITILMESLKSLANYKLFIYAAILILVMIFLPGGVLNSKSELAKGTAKLKRSFSKRSGGAAAK
jgi:branched-chain amino acid transport system permease protein